MLPNSDKATDRPFIGTARDYALYRVPYPESLINELRTHTKLTGVGNLLDLGCGPGRLTLPLSDYFSQCIAVDVEPEMVDYGKKLALAKGIKNIRWIVDSSETIELPAHEFELITIGEAFHRMNRPLVAKKAFRWLKPGGWITLLWQDHLWHTDEHWARTMVDIINRWTRKKLLTRQEMVAAQSKDPFENYLSSNKFDSIEEKLFEVNYQWSIESIIGILRSTSFASHAALAGYFTNLETELRRELPRCNPSGEYDQTITFGFIVGHRPIETTICR